MCEFFYVCVGLRTAQSDLQVSVIVAYLNKTSFNFPVELIWST